jgi:hypothetical protein
MGWINIRNGSGSVPGRVVLIRPDAPMRTETATRLGPHLARVNAARLGILDNAKANADALLDVLVDELRSRYGLELAIARRKAYPTYPAPKELIDELARVADCVVTAIGD